MNIRPALWTDAKSIAQIHVQAWRENFSMIVPPEILAAVTLGEKTGFWQDMIERGTSVQVAVTDEDEVIGFVAAGPFSKPDMQLRGEVYDLFVARAYQRTGIGKALLERQVELVREAGYLPVAGWTFAAGPAIHFLHSQGWRPLRSRMEAKYGPKGRETLFVYDPPVDEEESAPSAA